MRIDRLRYKVCGLVVGSAIAVAAAAGCSSPASSSGSTSTSSANSAGSVPASQSSAGQPTGQPSADQTPSPSAPGDPVSSARRAAEAVQGPAAVATAAQLAALDAESGVIDRMSPEQLAGQRVIYSYRGLKAPAHLLSLIRHGDVGGVIFFGPNISSPAQLSGEIAQMVAANASKLNPARTYPLLLMTDQEGGEVRRLQWAGPDQSEAQIGASSDPAAAATAAGAQAASGLRAVGINVNLAPVLDVYRKAGDFDDQFQRSYSMNPDVVGQAGAAFITAQQQGGVAATVKHFPGLGAAAAAQDTDNKPVKISLSAGTLRSVDELPYESAIRAGVKLAMVSWANYPALGRLPAGLSVPIVQGELRQRLGYAGVTITDALGAGALRAYGSLENTTMLAGRAGMEALLCTGVSPLPGWKCVAGLKDGYTDGALPKTAFRAQLAQLLQLRASLPT